MNFLPRLLCEHGFVCVIRAQLSICVTEVEKQLQVAHYLGRVGCAPCWSPSSTSTKQVLSGPLLLEMCILLVGVGHCVTPTSATRPGVYARRSGRACGSVNTGQSASWPWCVINISLLQDLPDGLLQQLPLFAFLTEKRE